ncbi:pirin family protein [Ottowia sp.]|uniref:pirin family protein n=1 Tax=Ottowia sp. TaxID=1898956 RepID=UPI002CD3E7B8|nr:pirin family protein [Ottowia sp.]HRN74577.1 pirin family protein [Ottowia sp.]HRQ01967.1 pirin family protein [Ottowia sp.]
MTATTTALKRVLDIRSAPGRHWVGDGLPVHNLFGYNGPGVAERSPFLMLDYGAPYDFGPTTKQLGVGQHPHRGFETVTIVYSGELAHRDNAGGGGTIGPGDVQWMTAGGGIIHEEFHSPSFAQTGGTLEMAQLWVNLPAEHKMTPPGYQPITAAQIPVVDLPGGVGSVRVIAGAWGDAHGPARTFSPMRVLDLRLGAGKAVDLPQPAGWTTLVVVASGSASVNGAEPVTGPAVVTLSAAGEGVSVQADSNARLLLLAGEPIDEPVVGYGPFVMNSQQQIVDAINDFNSGRFGQGLN